MLNKIWGHMEQRLLKFARILENVWGHFYELLTKLGVKFSKIFDIFKWKCEGHSKSNVTLLQKHTKTISKNFKKSQWKLEIMHYLSKWSPRRSKHLLCCGTSLSIPAECHAASWFLKKSIMASWSSSLDSKWWPSRWFLRLGNKWG